MNEHTIKSRRYYSEHPLYGSWRAMRRACGLITRNSERDAVVYAGIGVCDEWQKSYAAYETWCLGNGWRKGLVISRLDKTMDFSPSNCIVTEPVRAVGMRRCAFKLDGKPIRQVVGYEMPKDEVRRIEHRIKEGGWEPDSAISTPVMTLHEAAAKGGAANKARLENMKER